MKKKQGMAWILAICLLLGELVGLVPVPAAADVSASAEPKAAATAAYAAYLAAHGDPATATANDTITIPAASVNETEAYLAEYQGKSSVLVWDEQGTAYSWTFTAKTAGYYRLALTYAGVANKQYDITLDVLLDGAAPYPNTLGVKLHRLFLDETYAGPGENVFLQNLNGDEIMPALSEQYAWQTQYIYDSQGAYPAPLYYWLDTGEHTITLTLKDEAFALDAITFLNLPKEPTYAETLAAHAPAAQDEFGDLDAGFAKFSILHRNCSFLE